MCLGIQLVAQIRQLEDNFIDTSSRPRNYAGAKMFCMKCGTELPTAAAFCFRCGTPLQRALVPEARVERRDITLVTITCPVCGGPLNLDGSRCMYCGSVVVIKTDMPRIDPSTLKHAVINQHITEYREAVRSDGNDETAHYGLGIAYYNLGLIDEATVELEEAVRLVPENPNIQYQLAIFYTDQRALRGIERALERLERALKINPKMLEAILLKAELHSNLKYSSLDDIFPNGEGSTETSGAEKAMLLWEQAYAIDPNSIRSSVASFLSLGNWWEHDLEYAGPENIVINMQWFKIRLFSKRGSRNIEDELDAFLQGDADPSRLLAAARYVVCVMCNRNEFRGTRNTSSSFCIHPT